MSRTISLRLENEEFDDFETLVESEGYHSKAEFIRKMIRDAWDEWAIEKRKTRNLDDYISLDDLERRVKSSK